MATITEDFIRKRAEHNEGMISTLEELSLHQLDIIKIENIDKWCRELKILYLQSNLIPRIENVKKLKKLEYLNLALNNVEVIENLEGCESLTKLDLTANFVGRITSVENLKNLEHFKELYMTGNPCTQFEGYREYVIATLPRLKHLDGIEISRSERILAEQKLKERMPKILQQEKDYIKQRETEKRKAEKQTEKKPGFDRRWYTDVNNTTSDSAATEPAEANGDFTELTDEQVDQKNTEFWKEQVPYSPEARLEVHEHMKKVKSRDEQKKYPDPNPPKRERRLQTEDGRVLNCNEPGLEFDMDFDDLSSNLVITFHVWKYLSTQYLELDIQPTYIRLTVKGKVIQLVLPEEVRPDSSTAERAATTGYLTVTMPKVKPPPKKKSAPVTSNPNITNHVAPQSQYLEVDPSVHKYIEIDKLMQKPAKEKLYWADRLQSHTKTEEKPVGDDFIDDPDVPPLE